MLKAVQELRLRKNRKSKPLAVMMRDIAVVKRFCIVSKLEEKLKGAADYLLTHNREICVPVDDSVGQLAIAAEVIKKEGIYNVSSAARKDKSCL